jgi:hypothetical protein
VFLRASSSASSSRRRLSDRCYFGSFSTTGEGWQLATELPRSGSTPASTPASTSNHLVKTEHSTAIGRHVATLAQGRVEVPILPRTLLNAASLLHR